MNELSDRVADALRATGRSIQASVDASPGEQHWLLEPACGTEPGLLVAVYDEADTIVCHSVLPTKASPTRLVEAMEFTTRANRGLLEGNFEMDLDDGEVRFKTSLHVTRSDVVAESLDHALRFNLAVVAVYRAALDSVLSGRSSASNAIASIEER